MKTIVFFVVLGFCSSPVVRAQSNNYLLRAYDSALEMKALYDDEIEYWREFLTGEAGDVGYYFTDIVTRALDRFPNEVQGAGITRCTNTTATYSRANINSMADELLATEVAAVILQNSVTLLLTEMNIKEYDLELFYYYHSLKMQEAYEKLIYEYVERMSDAWLHLFMELGYHYDQLQYCILDVFPVN